MGQLYTKSSLDVLRVINNHVFMKQLTLSRLRNASEMFAQKRTDGLHEKVSHPRP